MGIALRARFSLKHGARKLIDNGHNRTTLMVPQWQQSHLEQTVRDCKKNTGALLQPTGLHNEENTENKKYYVHVFAGVKKKRNYVK